MTCGATDAGPRAWLCSLGNGGLQVIILRLKEFSDSWYRFPLREAFFQPSR
jgi:hypothetical protein